VLETNYQPVSSENPYGNVLLTDIADDPERLPAPPAFNQVVRSDINNAVRTQTQTLHPTIHNTTKQLFGDLYNSYNLDFNLARLFYSMPNTRVANDQGAFANWLFGGMHSSKEDTPEGAIMRIKNTIRYPLV